MKKKLIVVSLAILIGGILAFFTLTKIKVTDGKKETISLNVLQTGVFSSYENALEQKGTLTNAVILPKDGYYFVLVGASTNETGLEKIEKALNNKNIHYYKKKMEILEKDKELFLKYNMLLEKAENEETVLLLNKKILEKMSEV